MRDEQNSIKNKTSQYEEVFMSQSEKKGTQESARSSAVTNKKSRGLTAEERAAMREHVKELKAEGRENQNREQGERDVLAKIAEMLEPDRTMAGRIHEIITSNAPVLLPRLWYGMPAYSRDGNVVCFFQCAQKFKARYSTLGFNDKARLDEGTMWPTSFALTALTEASEARIIELVKKAVSQG
jgi:uncharacterized protein YdhG (YjbR/CyaY superfamily)